MAYTLSELMTAFSRHYDFEEFIPDENGVYSLECDGLAVMIREDVENDRVKFYSTIAPAPKEGNGKLAQILLQLNHHFAGGEGAQFSRDPKTGDYLLEEQDTLSSFTEESFRKVFGQFIRVAQKWNLLIAEFNPNNSKSVPGNIEHPPTIPLDWLAI